MSRLALALAFVAGCTSTPSNWSEAVSDRPDLTLLHERDATGHWITVLDGRLTELCMFSADPGESLDSAHIAKVCQLTSLDSRR